MANPEKPGTSPSQAPAPQTTKTSPGLGPLSTREAVQAAAQASGIERSLFGEVAGRKVDLFTLRNRQGLILKLTNFGATVTELHVPDRQGKLEDIVLGFDTLQGYIDDRAFIGATVGRCANRIANARFELEGKTYELVANDPPHHLHGGRGWHKVVWKADASMTARGPAVEMTYVSPDGEDNYPGTVTAKVTFTLTDDNEMLISMRATTDKTTIVNMAHHGYFNLGGPGVATVHGHELQMHASRYTPGTPVVPDGRVVEVRGTAFDFTKGKTIGAGIAALGEGNGIGFDQNFIVDGEATAMREVARLAEPTSGRVMVLSANQPGVQLYTGQFLDGAVRGKNGRQHVSHDALCLETQAFPNAISVSSWAHQVLFKSAKPYLHEIAIEFTGAH